VGVDDRVGQPDDRARRAVADGGHQRVVGRAGGGEPLGPARLPLGGQVAVEEAVAERAPVVPPPAVGVELGDAVDVGDGGSAEADGRALWSLSRTHGRHIYRWTPRGGDRVVTLPGRPRSLRCRRRWPGGPPDREEIDALVAE